MDKQLKNILKSSGYDLNYAIGEPQILGLLQKAYKAGQKASLKNVIKAINQIN